MSVFITDGLLRMTLAAVRSLGAKRIDVGIGEFTKINPAAYSKYCHDSWVYPDPRKQPQQYVQALLDKLEREKYRFLYPMDEIPMALAIQYRDVLEQRCHFPAPPTDSYLIASDKALSVQTALSQGVDAPQTLTPASLSEVHGLARSLGFPLVVKARRSSGSRGIRVVRNESQLMSIYEEVHRDYPLPALQAYVPTGDRYDVGLLYDRDGKLKASFVQKEVRHFPSPIGPSTVQESVWMPELLERAKTIMSALPWYGIAELEFMVDPRDGIPKLLEINPRFWGSLHLAVQSGIDFPYLLYRIASGEKVEETFDYRIGQRGRNILPGDLLHFLTSRDRLRLDPPFLAGKKHGGEDDILSWKDPLPTVGFVATSLRYMFDPNIWKRLLKV